MLRITMRNTNLTTFFLILLFILLPLSGCLGDDSTSRTETAEDGTERCWTILQTITTMEHESEMMRNNHYTMTNMTYDASCNLIYSSWWGGDGYGGYSNFTYNAEGQRVLIEIGSGDWNNSTGTLEDIFLQFSENTYENGLLMQHKSYYEGGVGEEYWNYTYDSDGRVVLEEAGYTTVESFYNSDGLLEQTKSSGWGNSTTYTNYTYDDAGQQIQVTITYGYNGNWYDPTYTNNTYTDGLLVSSTYNGDLTTYTYNEKGDLIDETRYWGDNFSSSTTHTWGYADTV
jgi:YD repeat-containing protein